MLPLRGTTVVSLEQAVSAPFCTRQLADQGARVIKIERPGVGDFARAYDAAVKGASSHFVWLNRSKESVTLDIKKPAALTVLHRLLERADVFVQNLAPGAVDRLGLSVNELRRAYPRLIICTITGYGLSGPYAQKKAYDLLVQGETGFLSITGTVESPAKAGISIADIAGAMYAYSGILTALLVRHQTGQGCAVDVSLFDALGEWMGYAAYYAMYGGVAPPRMGSSHAAIAPYGPFTAGDGAVVYLAVQNDREWRQFCDVALQKSDLASDCRFVSNSARVKHRDALQAVIDSVFLRLTIVEVVGRLDAAHVANARMNTIQQFVAHPQLSARGRWRDVESPVGPVQALIPPVSITDVETVMDPIPSLGQHTDSVLRELDFDRKTIRGWHQDGTI
jgi:itaconate CoA-transferase